MPTPPFPGPAVRLLLILGMAVCGTAALPGAGELGAQSIREGLIVRDRDDARAWIRPVSEGLVRALPAGLRPPGRQDSVRFELGVRWAAAFPEDDPEGSGGSDHGTVYFGVVEATMAIGRATRFTGRFAPTVELSDALGDASVFGFSAVHSVAGYLRLPPRLRLAVGATTQRLRAGGYLEATAVSFDLTGGVDVGPLVLYGRGAAARGEASVGYRIENPGDSPELPPDGTRIEFDDPTPWEARFGVGAQLVVRGLALSSEYVSGAPPAVTVGVAAAFR